MSWARHIGRAAQGPSADIRVFALAYADDEPAQASGAIARRRGAQAIDIALSCHIVEPQLLGLGNQVAISKKVRCHQVVIVHRGGGGGARSLLVSACGRVRVGFWRHVARGGARRRPRQARRIEVNSMPRGPMTDAIAGRPGRSTVHQVDPRGVSLITQRLLTFRHAQPARSVQAPLGCSLESGSGGGAAHPASLRSAALYCRRGIA